MPGSNDMGDRVADERLAAQEQEIARQRAGDRDEHPDDEGSERQGDEFRHRSRRHLPRRAAGVDLGDLVGGQHVLKRGQPVVAGRGEFERGVGAHHRPAPPRRGGRRRPGPPPRPPPRRARGPGLAGCRGGSFSGLRLVGVGVGEGPAGRWHPPAAGERSTPPRPPPPPPAPSGNKKGEEREGRRATITGPVGTSAAEAEIAAPTQARQPADETRQKHPRGRPGQTRSARRPAG